MHKLAVLYYYGDDFPLDREEALKLFMAAAEGGNADTQRVMGYFYENGIMVERDIDKAKMWYSRAIESGCEEAIEYLNNLEDE